MEEDRSGLEFNEKADMLRSQCNAERRSMQDGGVTTICEKKPLNAVPQAQQGRQDDWYGNWRLLSLAVDSGATEFVGPHELLANVPTLPSLASQRGVMYEVASGHQIPNEG